MVKKQKKNKKWAYWLLMLVLFVVVGVIVYLVWNTYFKGNNEEQNSGVTTEIVEVEKKEEPQRQEKTEVTEKPKVVQYDGDDPNDGGELSGVITYAGVNGDYLMVRVNIDQYLEDGECKLSLMSSDGVIHEEVAEIGSGASTASCNGFNVPLSGLGQGRIDIVIDLTSNDKNGTIRGEVNI